jgi:hypothetical protein
MVLACRKLFLRKSFFGASTDLATGAKSNFSRQNGHQSEVTPVPNRENEPLNVGAGLPPTISVPTRSQSGCTELAAVKPD